MATKKKTATKRKYTKRAVVDTVVNGVSEVPTEKEVSASDQIKKLTVLDIRFLELREKMAVIDSLRDEGYLFPSQTGLTTMVGQYRLEEIISVTTLINYGAIYLRHENKLMYPGDYTELSELGPVSPIKVEQHIDVMFGEGLEKFISNGDVLYERVN